VTEPAIASREPYLVEVEAGETYWWCACGRSQSQPWCDGSHEGTGIEPVEYKTERNRKLWLCGCKRTARPPMCDGAHKNL
jgi:CDGSH-type Zn-finger protein